MPLSPEFYKSALDTLSASRPIRARKMFGGAGVYLDEVFFSVLDDDRIFFKVDAENVGEYDALGMGPWVMMGEPQDHYRELPPSIYEDASKLGEWMDKSAAAAARKKKKKS